MDAFEAVSLPESLTISRKKYFTLAEANRALVLIRRIVSDVVRDYKKLRELHTACRAFHTQGDTKRAEIAREQYALINDHLAELNEELEKIGCDLKDYRIGLVYFPSMQEEKEIYLCWKLGEDSIHHWHLASVGYAGRQPVTEAMK